MVQTYPGLLFIHTITTKFSASQRKTEFLHKRVTWGEATTLFEIFMSHPGKQAAVSNFFFFFFCFTMRIFSSLKILRKAGSHHLRKNNFICSARQFQDKVLGGFCTAGGTSVISPQQGCWFQEPSSAPSSFCN